MAQIEQYSTFVDNAPKVSIVMPNLNNRRFLPERLDSILQQTLSDWEIIVIDSYSDDGAWELIQEYAANDSRFRISQAPRDGIYPNLNRCIKLARGEYVYVATSDDTMVPSCLEKMVNAMNEQSECGICHTCLKVINEDGQEVSSWWQNTLPALFYQNILSQPHIRRAPYDGILYCALQTVFISLTQLLIRRSVFEKVGTFRSDWHSAGDFEWGMRATLVCNILHLPETLATWRLHHAQATSNIDLNSSTIWAQWCEMIQAALPILKTYSPKYARKIHLKRLLLPYKRQFFWKRLHELERKKQRIMFIASFLPRHPKILGEFLMARCFNKSLEFDHIQYIRKELARLELNEHITLLDL